MVRRYRNRTGGNYYRARSRKQKAFERSVKKIAREVVQSEPEIKYLDTAISEGSVYTGSSAVNCLTLIPGGLGETDRTGYDVKLRSVQIRLFGIDVGSGNDIGDVQCRALLCLSRTCDGADLTVTETLTSDNTRSLRNWNYRKDVTVLKDKFFIIRKADTVGHKGRYCWNYYKKFNLPIKCSFTTDNGNIAATNNNHLFLILMADMTLEADAPSFYATTRVTFTDA